MKNVFKISLLASLLVSSLWADEQFGGIGVTIFQIRDGVQVAEIIPGTPAADTKLQAGDKIIAVDGESLKGFDIETSKAKLRGLINKPVEITYVSGVDTLTEILRRTQITIKNFESESVENWYNKKDFDESELENYAQANVSDKQLVAVLKQGYLIQEKTVSAQDINGIFIDKLKEFKPKENKKSTLVDLNLKGFNRHTISFESNEQGPVRISVMNTDGAIVANLNENAKVGYNVISWNGENAPSGRYMVTIELNGSVSGKNTILK